MSLQARVQNALIGIRRLPVIGRSYEVTAKYVAGCIHGRGQPKWWLHQAVRRREFPESEDHFFGYYDKSPWSADGQKILYHRKRPGHNSVDVVCFDLATDQAHTLDTTPTWNWQQGAMLQWVPTRAPDQRHVIYNSLSDGQLVARIRDADSGAILKTCSLPVQTIRSDGQAFISLNYRRLAELRPDYGYFVDADNFSANMAPDTDGLFRYDIDTDVSTLIVSLERLMHNQPCPTMQKAQHKVNHAMYAPAGRATRLVFLHRWIDNQGRKRHRLYSVNDDGSDLQLLTQHMVSHYSWIDSHRLICFCHQPSEGNGYYVFDDGDSNTPKPIAQSLTSYGDGHPSFDHSRRWMITDCYPKRDRRTRLLLFDSLENAATEIGRFYLSPMYYGSKRCDHHPRWSPDGKSVSVDSCEAGVRKMSFLDVSTLLK
jgi:hypothetical protein